MKDTMLLFATVLIVGLIQTQAEARNVCQGIPENVNVLLPNPEDCGSYIQCVHQKPMVRPCPGGLHWSVAATRCEWPDIAKCKIASCSGVPSNVDVLLPNPKDCGSYIQCVHQKPVVRPCPGGLHWSVAANRCEWPNIANCKITLSNTTVSPPRTTPSSKGNWTTTTTVPITTIPSKNGNWTNCSNVPFDVDVLLPNPHDCESYIQCVYQHPVIKNCTYGLHWNDKLKVCDRPEDAGCQKNQTTNSAWNSTEIRYNSTITSAPPTNHSWSGCDGVPDNINVLLPNPQDCESYIQCVHQKPMVRPCPGGLHWSVAANRCEWPDIAKCNIANCSGVPSNVDVLLPNPKDCGSYIQCVHQKPVVRPCPGGLHWSVAANRCEWPNIAKCKITLSNTTVSPPRTTPSSKGNWTTTTPVPITTIPSKNGNWTNCSNVPFDVNVLLPNPHDCESYIQCVYQHPVIMNCTYGLHWNDKLKVCDRPEDAGCQKNQTTNSAWNSTEIRYNSTTTSAPPTNHSWSGCDGVPDNINVLLPNPQDCESYIQCVHQKPMVRPCPGGLHWSVAANRCEWPDIAKCNIANCSGVPSNVDVLLPNPKDCGSYIQCVHQKPVVRPCPGGLHWSVAANRCEWPNIAGCQYDIPA